MELTQKSFSQRLTDLQNIVLNPEQKDFLRYKKQLHEKGVECALLIPMLEVVMDFDTFSDVAYEQASKQKNSQRFDFLLQNKFLVEAKELNANLDAHYKQIQRYIFDNTDINYGMLTNGIDFQIWVQKSYIEKISNTTLPHTDNVTKVFDFSIREEKEGPKFVLDVLSIFRKEKFEETFRSIASVAGAYASSKRGKKTNLHDDIKIDKRLHNKIQEAISIKKGIYYEEIRNNNMSPGETLIFEDNCVKIAVEVTETGTVILEKGGANILDFNKALESGWAPMTTRIAEEWSKEPTEFQDPIEIIKLGKNIQKLHRKELYEFKSI